MIKNKMSDLGKFVIISCIVGILNLFTYANFAASVGIVIVEITALVFLLLKTQYDEFYCMFLIFLCMSFEFNDTVGSDVLYGFKAFEIVGINLSLLILVFFIVFYRLRRRKICFDKRSLDGRFIFSLLIIGFLGVFNGILSLTFNDNDIDRLSNPGGMFLGQVYLKFLMELIIALSVYYAIRKCEDSLEKIKNCLVAILIGGIITMIVSRASGIMGTYGGVKTLQIQNIIRYIPFLYIYSITEKKRLTKFLVFFLSTVGMIFTLLYNATGKMLMLYAFVPIAVVFVTFKKDKKLAICEVLVFPIILLLGGTFILSDIQSSTIFSSKLREVVALFDFGPGWLKNMPVSPRVRIAEFVNVLYEYIEHPLRIITGKGYLGTIKDHVGLITNVLDAYSVEQDRLGIFYALHESINNLFLTNGIIGLIFIARYVILLLKHAFKSMHAYSALFWLFFAYGFSFTLTGYGITAMMVCLYEISLENRKEKVVI